MALLHEEDDYNHTDEKKEYGAEDRCSSEPQKALPTGEFVIVAAKFGGQVLHRLASRFECDEAGRQTKTQIFLFSFYNFCTVLCTISGFSNIKAV